MTPLSSQSVGDGGVGNGDHDYDDYYMIEDYYENDYDDDGDYADQASDRLLLDAEIHYVFLGIDDACPLVVAYDYAHDDDDYVPSRFAALRG